MARPNINAMRNKIAATEVFAKPENEKPVQPILVSQLERLRAQRAAQPQEAVEAPVEPAQAPVDTKAFIKERAAKKAALAAQPKPVKQPEPEPVAEVVEATASTDWMDLMDCTNDRPIANIDNAAIAITHAPELTGLVAYDDFTQAKVRMRNINKPKITPVRWHSTMTTELTRWIGRNARMPTISRDTVLAALDEIATLKRMDSLMDTVAAYPQWDGVERLDSWLIDYAGAEDNHLNRVIGRKFLIGMINRAMIPGCTCKRSLVLLGKQNIGKSGLCRILAGNDQWFDTDLRDMDNSVTMGNQLRGKWLIEISEGCGISKSDRNSLKKFLSKHADQYTPKHSNDEVYLPRRVSFIITTNDAELFNDPTGASRFALVEIGQVDFEGLTAVRDQLFAEAYAAHLAGERNEHTPEDEAAIEERCKNYSVVDEMEPAIAKFLSTVVYETTIAAVMKAIGIPFSPNGAMVKRAKDILVKFGWVNRKHDGLNFLRRTEDSFPPVDPEVADRAANGTTNIRSMRTRMKG